MSKFMLIALTLVFSPTLFAGELLCHGQEIEEYTIDGQFGGHEVEMFDNNTSRTFRHVMDLESYPVQMIYHEVGVEKSVLVIMGTTSATETATTAQHTSEHGTVVNFTCTIQP
jgi:hypothetical protein